MSTFNDFTKISFTKFKLRKKRFIFTIIGVSAGIAILAMGFALLDGGVRYARKQALAQIRPREFKEIRIFPQDQFMPRIQYPEQTAMLTAENLTAINNLLPFSIVSPYIRVSTLRLTPPKYGAEDIESDPDFTQYYGAESLQSRSDILLKKDAEDLDLSNFTYGDLKYNGDRKKKLTPFTIEGASREWMESYPNVSLNKNEGNFAVPLILSYSNATALLGIADTYNVLYPYDARPLSQKLSDEDAQKVQGLIGQEVYIFLRPPQTEKYTSPFNGTIVTARIMAIVEGEFNFIPYEKAEEIQAWLIQNTKDVVKESASDDRVEPDSPSEYPMIFVLAAHVNEIEGIVKTLKSQGYSATSYLNQIEFIQKMESTLKNILYVLTAIIILLVTLLIMNTLGKIIQDSTKEIGIFRALGAKKKHIVKIFIIEALTMAYLGGLIGIAVGWLASIAVSFGFLTWIFTETNSYGDTAQQKMPTYFIGFPLYYYLLIIFATLALAAITGYARARKASSLHIVNALRDERG